MQTLVAALLVAKPSIDYLTKEVISDLNFPFVKITKGYAAIKGKKLCLYGTAFLH
jgi:hypothetical protein